MFNGLFRTLTDLEDREFRNWARRNYAPLEPINEVWHPSVQDECRKMNHELNGEEKGL